ncbi:MAG: hypothetical protein MNPFHGCM_00292 [Gemmatimonadaceae bacterium]|nr:hypothetical protein [Gemmatimonadaceae bacterium]
MHRSILVLIATSALIACGGGGADKGTTQPPGPASVASVVVTPNAAQLEPNGTAQLAATTKDASGNTLTGRTITWTTSSSAIASVTSSGLVTAVAAGSATITATSEGQSGTAAITVVAPAAAVVTVVIDQAGTTLVPTQALQLTATPKDGNGNALTGRTIAWTTSAPTVASITASGLATAVGVGTAAITATSEGKSGTINLTVAEGAVIGASGGTVTGGNGSVELTIPPGAVSAKTPISITPVSGALPVPAKASLAGTAYQIGPAGLTFSQPITIKMKYDVATLPLWSMGGDLTVVVNSGADWTSLGGITVDPATKTVSGKTTSLGSLGRSIATRPRPMASGPDGVATQVLLTGTPPVTTIAVNWATVTLTPALDSVNNQKRSVMVHASIVPTGAPTQMPAPPGITKPTALWRYRWRTTGRHGTFPGSTNDTGWIDSPDVQYICTDPQIDLLTGSIDDVIVDVLLNPGTENDPANQQIVRQQISVFAGLKKTYEISPDDATIGPGVAQQLRFIARDQNNNIIPAAQGTTFKWKNSDFAGTISSSQTEYVTYTAKQAQAFTSPPPRVDRVDADIQGSGKVVERFTHWDFSKFPWTLINDSTVTTTYNLQGSAHTFVTVHVPYTVTLSPANATVAVGGQPQPLQVVLSPAYNGTGLAYVWTSPGTHGTLSETNGNHSANKSATYTPNALDQGGIDQISVKVVSWVANTELETLGTASANITVDANRKATFSARQIPVNGGVSWFTTATLEIPKVPGAKTYQVIGTILGAPYSRTFTGATSTNTQSLNEVLDGGNTWYINLNGGYNTIKSQADIRLQNYRTQYSTSTATYKATP